jgi:hypothetical protein
MKQVLFRFGFVVAIAASVIVLAWSEAPLDEMAAAVSIWAVSWGLGSVLVGSLIGAVILRAGAAWVARKDVPYGEAYGTMVLCGIAGLILGVVLIPAIVAVLPLDWEVDPRIGSLSAFPLAFLIDAGIIGVRHEIPFRRAILVCLVMLVIAVALALIVAGIAYLIRWGYRRTGVVP